MANTPSQVALDEHALLKARNVVKSHDIATIDYALEVGIRAYLSSLSGKAGDDGQGALVERYADATKRNAAELATMPIEVIRQNYREFASEYHAHLTRENAALRADKERLEQSDAHWQENMRDNHAAFAAMRNDLNEIFPIQSAEADLLEGPELSVACAAIVKAAREKVERLERELEASKTLAVKLAIKSETSTDRLKAAERRLAEQGQAQGEAGRFAERVVAACRAYMNTYDVLADEVREHMQVCMADALRAADAIATPPSPEPDAELVRLRDLLFVADRALMEAIGFFPLDRATEKQRVLNDACWLIRQETSDSYEVRRARAETALRRHRKQGGE